MGVADRYRVLMCLEIDANVAGVFYSIVCKNKLVLRAYYDIR